MNFQQLKYVREAVRTDFNLTEVAESLSTSQSGVSKQIKDLEIELGVEIFVRKGKRLLGLTKAGEGVADIAERILLETENLKRYAEKFTREDVGVLVIATTHNQARYTLPDVVQRFTQAFPNVQLELRQGTPKYAAQTVIRGQADLAIATEALDEFPELATFPCFSWRHVVVTPHDHPLTEVDQPTLADVARYPVITYSSDFSGRPQIDQAFARAGLKPEIRLTAMDADVIKTYVARGLGVGLVAEHAMKGEEGGGLVALQTDAPLFAPSTTKVAVQRGALLRGYAYRFIEMVAPHLKEAELAKAVGREIRHLRASVLGAPGKHASSVTRLKRAAG